MGPQHVLQLQAAAEYFSNTRHKTEGVNVARHAARCALPWVKDTKLAAPQSRRLIDRGFGASSAF